MTIQIEHEKEAEFAFDTDVLIRDVVIAALDYEECPYEAEVNVVLTGDAEIQEINSSMRGIDRPTDVLSFPMVEYPEPSDYSYAEEYASDCFHPESGELLLGDMMISVDKVREQAAAYGHSEKRELAFLVAHSMLHLLGYDHMEDDERLIMEKKQNEILEKLGITRDITD